MEVEANCRTFVGICLILGDLATKLLKLGFGGGGTRSEGISLGLKALASRQLLLC